MKGKSLRTRAPVASTESVKTVMESNWGGNTLPERILRSALHQTGLRFLKDFRPLPEFRCTADVVFRKERVCIFVDGCYWHGCTRHFKVPKTNTAWWKEKIDGNQARDRRQTKALAAARWKVIRVWEHALTPPLLGQTVAKIERAVKSRRNRFK
jgi:DNA mismatch endonuclease (patch repair protein)